MGSIPAAAVLPLVYPQNIRRVTPRAVPVMVNLVTVISNYVADILRDTVSVNNLYGLGNRMPNR